MSNFNLIEQTKSTVSQSDLLVAGSIVGSFLFLMIKTQRNKVLVLHKKPKRKKEEGGGREREGREGMEEGEEGDEEDIKNKTKNKWKEEDDEKEERGKKSGKLVRMEDGGEKRKRMPIKTFVFNPAVLQAFKGKSEIFKSGSNLSINKDLSEFLSMLPKPKRLPIDRLMLTADELQELKEMTREGEPTFKEDEGLDSEIWSVREYEADHFDLENVYEDFLDNQKNRMLGGQRGRKRKSPMTKLGKGRGEVIPEDEEYFLKQKNQPPPSEKSITNNDDLFDRHLEFPSSPQVRRENDRSSLLPLLSDQTEYEPILKKLDEYARKRTSNPLVKSNPSPNSREEVERRVELVSNINSNILLNVKENGDLQFSTKISFTLKKELEEDLSLDYSGKYIVSLVVNGKSINPSEVWFNHKLYLNEKTLKIGRNNIQIVSETESVLEIRRKKEEGRRRREEGNEDEDRLKKEDIGRYRETGDEEGVFYTHPCTALSALVPCFDQFGIRMNVTMGVLVPKGWRLITSGVEKLEQDLTKGAHFQSLSAHDSLFDSIEDIEDKRLVLLQDKIDFGSWGMLFGSLDLILENDGLKFWIQKGSKKKGKTSNEEEEERRREEDNIQKKRKEGGGLREERERNGKEEERMKEEEKRRMEEEEGSMVEVLKPIAEIMKLALSTFRKYFEVNDIDNQLDIVFLEDLNPKIFSFRRVIFVSAKLIQTSYLPLFYILLLKQLANQFILPFRTLDSLWFSNGLPLYLAQSFIDQIQEIENISKNLNLSETLGFLEQRKQEAIWRGRHSHEPLIRRRNRVRREDEEEGRVEEEKVAALLNQIELKLGSAVIFQMIKDFKKSLNPFSTLFSQGAIEWIMKWLKSDRLDEYQLNFEENSEKKPNSIRNFTINQLKKGSSAQQTDISLLNQSGRSQFCLRVDLTGVEVEGIAEVGETGGEAVLHIKELEGKYFPKAVLMGGDGKGFFIQKLEEKTRLFLKENIWKLGSQRSKILAFYCFLMEMEDKNIKSGEFLDIITRSLEKENSFVVVQTGLKLAKKVIRISLSHNNDLQLKYSEKLLFIIIKLIEQGKYFFYLFKTLPSFAFLPHFTSLLESIYQDKHPSFPSSSLLPLSSFFPLLQRILSSSSLPPSFILKYSSSLLPSSSCFRSPSPSSPPSLFLSSSLLDHSSWLEMAIKACQYNEKLKIECYEWVKGSNSDRKRRVAKSLVQQGQYDLNEILLDKYLEDLPLISRSPTSLKSIEFAKWLYPKESWSKILYERLLECVGKFDEEKEEDVVKFLVRKMEEGRRIQEEKEEKEK